MPSSAGRQFFFFYVYLHQLEILISLWSHTRLQLSLFLGSFSLWISSLALDPAEEYKMDNKQRGLALIFNQERFFWRLGLNDRHGTNADRYNLEKRYHFPASCWREHIMLHHCVMKNMPVLDQRLQVFPVVTLCKNCCVFQYMLNFFSPLF